MLDIANLPSHLCAIESRHTTDPLLYMRSEITLADVRHNASVLGQTELEYIQYAEALGFAHEYDVELKETATLDDYFLLLKKLHNRGLTNTKVMRKLLIAIAKSESANKKKLARIRSITRHDPSRIFDHWIEFLNCGRPEARTA